MGGARGEPFAWRKARADEPCGAADHAENLRVAVDDDLERAAGKHAYMMGHEAGTVRENPAGVVRTKRDERLWNQAKKQAAAQGRDGDWAYVMGIFKRSRGTRGNPAPAPGTPSPSMAQVMGIAKQLGVPNTRSAAFAKGFAYEWKEHGGGLDLVTIGQLVADHLAEDRHYYRNR